MIGVGWYKKLREFVKKRIVKFWIISLSLLLVLNYIVFLIYQTSHPSENLYAQLWVYFGSDAFKVITVSLILPILLVIFESHFKIVETIKNNREERKRKEEDQRRERRWECIEQTSKIWDELYSLSTEVRFFKAAANEEASIEDILQRLEKFANSAVEVVNMWLFRFPNLHEGEKNEAAEAFVVFMNIILNSATTVAYFIQESGNTKEVSEMQDSLERIQGGINTIAHHNILSILKLSTDLLGGALLTDREQSIKSDVNNQLNFLKFWADELKRDEMKNNEIFPHIEGKAVEDFRKTFKSIKKWKQNHPEKQVNESKEFSNFKKLFYEIPFEKRARARKIPYSWDYISHLADLLAFESTCLDLEW